MPAFRITKAVLSMIHHGLIRQSSSLMLLASHARHHLVVTCQQEAVFWADLPHCSDHSVAAEGHFAGAAPVPAPVAWASA